MELISIMDVNDALAAVSDHLGITLHDGEPQTHVHRHHSISVCVRAHARCRMYISRVS